MTVTITPLTPVFAGEVGPIDLRKVHDRETLEAIRAGMDRYAVLVFRDQRFTDQEQLDFAQRFDGTLHARTSSSAIGANRFGNEALTDVSNVDKDGNIYVGETVPGTTLTGQPGGHIVRKFELLR